MTLSAAPPQAAPGAAPFDRLDSIAPRRIALLVLAYVVTLATLRLSLSPFLEIDEAQFVGAVDLRLGYGNSHPPLYNWLVRGALELTGWNYPAAVTLVRCVLLAATQLLVFDTGRRLGGVGAGLVALAAAALLPQVSWMSAHTLAHSILAMAGAAGVLHALVLVATRPGPLPFLWLGAAAALGILGKYNLALLVVPLAVAVSLEPALRQRFSRPAALLTPAAFALLAGPVLVASAREAAPAERLARMYEDGRFAAVDLAGVGIDGVLSLALAALASGGIVVAAIVLFARAARADGVAEAVRRTLWRTLALGLAVAVAVAFAADLKSVDERYLTPLLMVLPPLAALHLGAWRGRRWFVLAGVAALLAVLPGIAGMVAFDNHRFSRPYAEVAAPVAAALPLPPAPVTIASAQQDLAANLVLALRAKNLSAFVEGDPTAPPAAAFVRVRGGSGPWPGGDPAPPAGYCPAAITRTEVPLANWSGRTMPLTALIATRC